MSTLQVCYDPYGQFLYYLLKSLK